MPLSRTPFLNVPGRYPSRGSRTLTAIASITSSSRERPRRSVITLSPRAFIESRAPRDHNWPWHPRARRDASNSSQGNRSADYLAHEPRFQAGELGRIDHAFEDGELNTLSKALAQLCHAPQAPLTCFVLCANVVGNQNEHKSSPEKRRVAIQVATEVTSEKQSLNVRKQPQRNALSQEWVLDFLLLALLPRD